MTSAEDQLADPVGDTTGPGDPMAPATPGGAAPVLGRPDLGWRALVAVAAAVSAVAGAPTYVVGMLVAATLLLAVERLARSRAENGWDSLLVLTGGVLAAVVLTGLVLGASPIGLERLSWALALSLVALGCLGAALRLPRPAPVSRATWLVAARSAPWVVAVVVVAVVAITVSVRSVGPAEEPPLQMSLGTVDGSRAEVLVSSAERAGPLELRTTDRDGDEISYPLFSIDAGRTYRAAVTIPRDGRYTISVNYPDQAQPLRTLILDR